EAHHVLTHEERERLESTHNNSPPIWLMLPFFGLFVGLGSFALGIAARTRTFLPLIWGGGFGGIPFLMSLAWLKTLTLFTLGPLAVAMAVWGYRAGGRLSWMSSLRGKS